MSAMTLDPYRGFSIEVDRYGNFEAEVGGETCRARSMDGMIRSIDAEMTLQDAEPVSIPVVTFGSDHVIPTHRPEIVNWHSVDYNYLSFKGTDPDTGEEIGGNDRVVRADTEIGRQVIALKRRLRESYKQYRELEKEYAALEDQYGIRPPDSLGTTWDYDRLAAQVWMVAALSKEGGS